MIDITVAIYMLYEFYQPITLYDFDEYIHTTSKFVMTYSRSIDYFSWFRKNGFVEEIKDENCLNDERYKITLKGVWWHHTAIHKPQDRFVV
jgi:hypothetical protein